MADTGKSSRIKVLDAASLSPAMRAGAQDMAGHFSRLQHIWAVKLCCLRSSWYFHVRAFA